MLVLRTVNSATFSPMKSHQNSGPLSHWPIDFLEQSLLGADFEIIKTFQSVVFQTVLKIASNVCFIHGPYPDTDRCFHCELSDDEGDGDAVNVGDEQGGLSKKMRVDHGFGLDEVDSLKEDFLKCRLCGTENSDPEVVMSNQPGRWCCDLCTPLRCRFCRAEVFDLENPGCISCGRAHQGVDVSSMPSSPPPNVYEIISQEFFFCRNKLFLSIFHLLNFPLAQIPTCSNSHLLNFPLAQLPTLLNFQLAQLPTLLNFPPCSTSILLNFPLAQLPTLLNFHLLNIPVSPTVSSQRCN